MRIVVVAAFALMPSVSHAGTLQPKSCQGVRLLVGADARTAAPAVARRLGISTFSIERTYRFGKWRVYFTRDPSDGYLFFPGDPRTARLSYVWGGIAGRSEFDAVRKRIKEGAAGVPSALAACIAYSATSG